MNKIYKNMSQDELKSELTLQKKYTEFKEKNLKLDMSRGKPSPAQLDLSLGLLDALKSTDNIKDEKGVDARNYGVLDGIPECKKMFADMLEVQPENIIVGGNSSLNLMYDTFSRSMIFGVLGATPWSKLEKIKFLCPAPGYDRHFGICEAFGIEMINIEMTNDGPDMEQIEKLIADDDSIKGIWCVPMYSNPMGITYSDETVKRFANLKPAAKDFRIFWDNAYCVHHLTNTPDKLLNIIDECKKANNEDMVYVFTSTSKISFSGGGISAIASSLKNITAIKQMMTMQTIGYDKINQLRHVRFFKDINGINAHMQKHRTLLEEKFACVIEMLDKEIKPLEIGTYTKPNGGYFISFNTQKGCAKRVGELCKEAGVVLTPVGATFPYGNDENNQNIRIAPTFPPVNELKEAMQVLCVSTKLATLENLIK
ncbi:MAG: aminotransferase class I/II-fold pyridoxal phosphate-dependent enzyme [Oscillospiraceae bacterium]